MKKNSIKILALAALALSLGACGSGGSEGSTSEATSTSASQETSSAQESTSGQPSEGSEGTSSEDVSGSEDTSSEDVSGSEDTSSEDVSTSEDTSSDESSSEELIPTTYELSEILTLDADAQWEHLGEKVIVEHLAYQGCYGNTLIGGAVVGQYISDLRGLEVNFAEENRPVFEKGSGWAADITVEGILIDVNGRAVVDDAVVTVNSERDPATGQGGLPVYYCPAQYFDRGFFNELGRKNSGIYTNGVYQIASLPEEITTEQGTDFYVVFPGENPDVEDLDNYSIINAHVPAGLSQNAVDTFNAYFAEKAVGEFIFFDGTLQFDTIESFGMGLLFDDFAARFIDDPAEDPAVFTSWEDLAADVNQYFNDPIEDLGDDRVFSYTYTYGGSATDVIKEEYVFLDDKENANCVTINYNWKPVDAQATLDDFLANLEALGFEELTGDLEGIFTLTTEGGEVVRELILSALSEEGMSYYYMAPAPVIDPAISTFATAGELKTAYEAAAGAYLDGFATALPFIEGGNEYVLDTTYETYNLETYGEGAYDYVLTMEGDMGWLENTTTELFLAGLETLGFEYKLFGNGYDFEGYWNEDTQEFVVFAAVVLGEEDGEPDQIVLEVYVLDDEQAAFVEDIPNAEFDSFDDLKAAYEARVGAFVDGFATALPAAPGAVSFVLDWEYETEFYEDYADEIYQYTVAFELPEESELTVEAYNDLLADAGFVAKRLDDYVIDGLFNPNTNEFIAGVAIQGNYLVVEVMALTADMVDLYIVDIPNLVTLDEIKAEIEGLASAEITAITGTATEYTMSFTSALDEDNFAGYTFVYASEGGYAQYYANYGLITQYAFDATFATDYVTALNAFVGALIDLGFVQASFGLFSNFNGYFNATTNEFIRIQYTDSFVRITLLVLDAKSAGYVTTANA